MTLEDINYIAQIVSAVAIIASLIFVGLQLRQTARNQRAVMHANRAESIRAMLRIKGDPAMARVLVAGSAADPDMASLDVNQYFFHCMDDLGSMHSQFLEWREGQIDAARWKITRAGLERLLESPGFRAVYMMWREAFAAPSFREIADPLLENAKGKTGGDQIAVWRALAAQERALIGVTASPPTPAPPV